MTKNTAQLLGAIAATLFMAFTFWERFRPPPCKGGVFIELHPPLSEPGPYQFRVELDASGSPCEFSVPLPLPANSVVDTKHCGMATELKSRTQGQHTWIVGLTIGAAPKQLRFQVKRGGEAIYDARVAPKYTPYPVSREENKRFCGEQAFVKPECIRGSSECAPFASSCTGPEACASPKVCCVSPEWGRDFGAKAASECSFSRGCQNRFGSIACHADADCPKGMTCDDKSLASEFKPELVICHPKAQSP